MAKNIKVGDKVTLGPSNGLGCGTFTVLKIYPRGNIHKLLVEGANGQKWPARIDGIRVVG